MNLNQAQDNNIDGYDEKSSGFTTSPQCNNIIFLNLNFRFKEERDNRNFISQKRGNK